MKDARRAAPNGPGYSLGFHPAASKELLHLEPRSQKRFRRAIDELEIDPLTARSGCDVKKVADLPGASTLHRLRVGRERACYAVVTPAREVWMLLFDDREVGYRRMVATAEKRFRGLPTKG